MAKMNRSKVALALSSIGAQAAGVTRLADIIVPEVFNPYVEQYTMELSRLIKTGVFTRSGLLDSFLAGAGMTIHLPAVRDLDNDEENYSDDDPTHLSTPKKIGTLQEVAVRMNRNQSWSSMDLTSQLMGQDPMNSIAMKVGGYWTRRLQTMGLACVNGIYKHNRAEPTGGSTHEKDDLIHDVVQGSTTATEATKFGAVNFIDALSKMGDAEDSLGMVWMHSIVYARAKKENLIDFIPDAEGKVNIPTYMGRPVVVDDALTSPEDGAGVYRTWIFGAGCFLMGVGSAPVPTAVTRDEDHGNGSGQETLYNRVEWAIHPVGYSYNVTPASIPQSGPTNTDLATAATWIRVAPERKMVKMVCLVTREFDKPA